ncbi:pro-resilin-like [Penaeus chinensis]|uniref:pro-resilin-like n=1 Tax=Penaeus chinensis TaxID=139456 RepID=UPI001FB635C7|nr:pro-resilin-like [Penaeus chinensis]
MALKVIALASLLAVASAKPGLSQSYQAPGSSFGGSAGAASFLRPAINFGGAASAGTYNPPVAQVTRPQYNFNYAVNDAFGNDFGHQEGRDGYNTQGSYYVQLPDGRLQRVTYTVNGDQGYVAQVTYEGVAQYPAFQPSASYSPAPSYGHVGDNMI